MKHKPKFKKQPSKQVMRLKDDHTWKAPKGYKIVVLDRGAVSFNVPEKWVVADTQPFEMRDQEPPDETARLSVSFWRFPPGIDWTGLPLGPVLEQSASGSEMNILERSPMHTSPRTDLEMVWMEHRFQDPVEPREAYSRMMVARGWDVTVLITFDFWVDDKQKFQSMWDEILRSLQLGRTIADPTKGDILH